MTKRIDYNRIVDSKAMRKHPNQSGLFLSKTTRTPDAIRIQAINPKTNKVTSHLYVEIPLENIPELIQSLQELV